MFEYPHYQPNITYSEQISHMLKQSKIREKHVHFFHFLFETLKQMF